jgi:hypothetical protein
MHHLKGFVSTEFPSKTSGRLTARISPTRANVYSEDRKPRRGHREGSGIRGELIVANELKSAAGLSSQIGQFVSTSVSNAFGRLRLLALTITIMGLPLTTGCWVQSVYPFYEESDVVADNTLVGTWAGEGELQPCLLNIAFDPGEKVYSLATSKSGEEKEGMKCAETMAKGHLVQLGSQRFLDVVPTDEKSPAELHSLVKIKPDRQNLVLVPMDADWLANAIRDKTLDLTARIDEKGPAVIPSVDVILTSPTRDLRNLLRESGDARGAFSDEDQMRFHKK